MNKIYKGAVFFDIDGTLLDEKCQIYTPTDKTKEAIKILKSRGFLTGVATGRAKCYMADVDIDFDCYLTCNGAVAEVGGEVVNNIYFPEADQIELISYLEKNDFGYNLETRDVCYYGNSRLELMKSFLEVFSINQSCFAPISDPKKIKANKSMVMFETNEQFNALVKKFGEKFSILKHRGYMSADIGLIGTSKASGVKAVVEKLNISQENIYAFGDAANDFEMLKFAKTGIAMTPHIPKLDLVADYVTGTVAEEGIYTALKHFNLI